MTIICAVHDAGQTWIGSDSLATFNDQPSSVGFKWATDGIWAFGLSGFHRATEVLEANQDALFSDLHTPFEFSSRVRDLLDEDGFKRSEKCATKNFGQDMILANRSTVWLISGDFSSVQIPEGKLTANGSGREYAMGAAAALKHETAEARMRRAIEIAIENDVYCGGDVTVRTL